MTDELKITGITIEADSVVIKGSDFDALCAIAREDKQIRECVAEALGNYAALRRELGQLQLGWQPIETAPENAEGIFWICPRTREDDHYVDTSGCPILIADAPRLYMGTRGGWSSLMKATHWFDQQTLLHMLRVVRRAEPQAGEQK